MHLGITAFLLASVVFELTCCFFVQHQHTKELKNWMVYANPLGFFAVVPRIALAIGVLTSSIRVYIIVAVFFDFPGFHMNFGKPFPC